MNITAKGLIKTVIVGSICYAAGKVITLGRLANACRCCPDEVMEEIGYACDFWKKFDMDNKEQEQPAPEIVQVTSAAEEETPEENQPED